VTLYLTAIDPVHLSIGFVLCPPTALVPLATAITARIIVFDIQVPILAGTSVELFVHSHDVPASISKLSATLDRATGAVVKQNPRCVASLHASCAEEKMLMHVRYSVLTKGVSAEVQITVRATSMSGPAARAQPVPIELFAVNKEMGRVLVRRGGETIAAGIVLGVLT
jgi:elongation factor 1 alpha-like protein